MKLAGASALTRIAQNPDCAWQVVMVRSGLNEPKFFQALTGDEYPKEYGERNSARRRGAKFERNAYEHNAALLRSALSGLVGVAESDIWVRNLEDEVPGGHEVNRIRRWQRTMAILKDHAEGKPTAQILIQPQLQLTMQGLGKRAGLFIAPDLLFLDRASGRYRPADLKSFVVRGHQVAPSDLERSRLQVAIQSLALHEALSVLRDERPPEHVGGFIFATPFGLKPHPPCIESLDASVDRVLKAIDALAEHARTIEVAKARDGAVKEILLLDEIPNNFQERCISGCALASVCQNRQGGKAMVLGDSAAQILGPDFPIARAVELMSGATARDMEEERIQALLADLGRPFEELRRVA
jgi:hypothetical protein